jgi:hypothetical protein
MAQIISVAQLSWRRISMRDVASATLLFIYHVLAAPIEFAATA